MPVLCLLLPVLVLCLLLVGGKLIWDEERREEADLARWEAFYWPKGRPARQARTLGETIQLYMQCAMVAFVPLPFIWLIWLALPDAIRYVGY